MQKLDIETRLSRHFLLFVVSLGVGLFFIDLWLPVGWVFKSILLLSSSAYIFSIFQKHYRRLVVRHDHRGWQVDDCIGKISSSSTITNWVSVLHVEPHIPGKKRSWVIFRDACDPASYRELIVRARYFK